MLNYIDVFNTVGISYTDYRAYVDNRLAEDKTTGDDNSEELLNYTKLNVQRMKRIDKTVVLSEETIQAINQLKQPIKLLIVAEGWCGDAAQILPVFNKIAETFPSKIAIKYILRDQNLEITDQFLTNGGRAIPIVLLLDESGDKVIRKWGPRPPVLQEMILEWKKETSDMIILAEHLHGWYAKNKTQAIQAEIINFLSAAE